MRGKARAATKQCSTLIFQSIEVRPKNQNSMKISVKHRMHCALFMTECLYYTEHTQLLFMSRLVVVEEQYNIV